MIAALAAVPSPVRDQIAACDLAEFTSRKAGAQAAARVATNLEKQWLGVLVGVPAKVHIQVMGLVSTFR